MFTSLHHLIDIGWMSEAYRRTRKDGATGIDGVTAADYEKDLEANLESLLNRIKSGSYRAPPVRRHYIPKADGTKRPLGIPTFEDKVAQRAVLMLLEPIYETDFLPCSYGFRRGRSAHDALSALRTGIIEQRQRWVIDADISKYFDSITHSHLRSFLDLRIKDGVARRMIDKWLKAGVLEEDTLHRPVAGTPQGGVISPTLSNIYLRRDEAPRAGASHARPTPDPEVVAKPKRRKFTAQYRLRILEEAESCTQPGAVGRLLRREGLYSSHLTEWRRARREGSLQGLTPSKRGRKLAERNPLSAKVHELEAKVARLEKELHTAHTILDVQGKVSGLLGFSLEHGKDC